MTAVKLTSSRIAGQGIDLGRDAEAHHRVDDDGQGRAWPGPSVKKAITNSSSDSVKTSSAPAMIAGHQAGDGDAEERASDQSAPRSREASSSDGSTWPRRPGRPRRRTPCRRPRGRAAPSAEPEGHRPSGEEGQQADGQHDVGQDRRAPARRRRAGVERVCRCTPTASSVPRTVDTTVAPTATTRVLPQAWQDLGCCGASSGYHRVLKPLQLNGGLDALKDITTSDEDRAGRGRRRSTTKGSRSQPSLRIGDLASRSIAAGDAHGLQRRTAPPGRR